MIIGQLLQTRVDPTNPKRIYYSYDEPGGTIVGNAGPQAVLGHLVSETKAGGLLGVGSTLWYQIRLNYALKAYNGKVYDLVWMKAQDLTASNAAPVTVWAASAASCYVKPALTSQKLKTVLQGQLVGTSDGTYNGAFLYIKLQSPAGGYTYSYVLKSQLTTADPALPGTASPELTAETSNFLDEWLGAKTARVVRWILVALALGLIGFVVWKVRTIKSAKK